MTRAYILIKTLVGTTEKAQAALREVAGVRQADIVTGDYDLIVIVEEPSAQDIGRLVMRDIHGIPGIEQTTTHVVIG